MPRKPKPKRQAIAVRLDLLDRCRAEIAKHAPEPSNTQAVEFLLKRGLDAYEAEMAERHGQFRQHPDEP